MTVYKVLAINPGSTSTKIAVFENDNQTFIKTIRHTAEEISQYDTMVEQFPFRKELILSELRQEGIDPASFNAVVGRGGLLRPIESGVYEVNERMKADLNDPNCLQHASNLGALIADSIVSSIPNARAYIADPVVVDELEEVARITGLPQCKRISIFHALNQKAIARIHARSVNRDYNDLNLIVAHLGGGISVGAHEKGRVVDVNNALYGEGAFSPERAGTLPTGQLVEMCFSGQYTHEDIKRLLVGKGGLVAHLGHNDAYKMEMDAKAGDEKARLMQYALGYNLAKNIGSMAAVLKGCVDAILITGGMAHDKELVRHIETMVSFIAPVSVYPGEDEMAALASNALMVLRGEVEPKVY